MSLPLLLASASPRRREMLERVGVALEVRPADVDEDPHPGEDPAAYVARIARAKAIGAKRRHAQGGQHACRGIFRGNRAGGGCD